MTLPDNFQDVNGCVLDAKKFHSSISFNTPSDALISSLFIKYTDSAGVPLSLFDDLLALLHHADFRIDGVTMHKSEDIMDRIADQRRLVARNRNGSVTYDEESKTPSSSHRPSSTLVPELVAEYIDSQRDSFHESLQTNRRRSDIFADSEALNVDNTLRIMSFVHRTWTDVAQRFLRRSITIYDNKTLRYVYQHPRIGPWVRKLRFHASNDEDMSPQIGAKEMSRLLCGILKKCPNITHLYVESLDLQCAVADPLWYPSPYPSSQLGKTAYDVLSQISDLKCLEHLYLCRIFSLRNEPHGFNKLCAILPCLPRLKKLSVQRWSGGSWPFWGGMPNMEEPINMEGFADTASPPETLTSLSLVDVDNIVFSLLAWLTKPDRGGRVTRIELSMFDFFRPHHPDGSDRGLAAYLRRSFKAELRNITYLQLVQYDNPYSDPSNIELLLELFPCLLSLSLCQDLGGNSLPRKYFTLPNHIQNLHFHLLEVPKEEDAHALEILKANPHLRHMLITYPSESPNTWDPPLVPPDRPLFNDSIEFCEKKKIEFVVTEVPTLPHFPDF